MNAKKLKSIRKTIRRLFPDMPARGHTEGPRGQVRIQIPHLQLDGTTLVTYEMREITGQIHNTPKTQRSLYRSIKKSPHLRAYLG